MAGQAPQQGRLKRTVLAVVLLGTLGGGCSSQPAEVTHPFASPRFPVNRGAQPGGPQKGTAPRGR